MSPAATDGLVTIILNDLTRVADDPAEGDTERADASEPGRLDRIITACLHDLADDRGRWS